MGRVQVTPKTVSNAPKRTVKRMQREKVRFALSWSPCPRIFVTRAVPPVPIMNPIPPRIIMNGMMRLMAAKGVLPIKLETNSPSTTP